MNRQHPDDDSLAARSRDGDPVALAMLYRRHATPLLAHLGRVLGARADAEDVLHETFLRIFLGRGHYHGHGCFRAWLFTVATHLALDRIRQQRRRGVLASLALDEIRPAPTSDPCAEVERRELAGRVEAALADLPPAHAMAFHLRVREDFSYREIAAMCGEPEGTLRSRVHHALIRVRRMLEPKDTHALRGPAARPAKPKEEPTP
jgi:RNA polymerase sigma-70 factor, ECF subfamily